MVTGTAQWERGRLGGITGSVAVSAASQGARPSRRHLLERVRHEMGGVTMLREAGGHLGGEFSRESVGIEALSHPNVCLRH